MNPKLDKRLRFLWRKVDRAEQALASRAKKASEVYEEGKEIVGTLALCGIMIPVYGIILANKKVSSWYEDMKQ